MQGQVVKIISKQFYVKVNNETIMCTERGILKRDNNIPLVGDIVLIDYDKKTIEKILPRKNELIRPSVSNIDQAFIITSLVNPNFSTNLLDKLISQLEINKIKPVICITKMDLVNESEMLEYNKILDYYKSIGYIVLFNSELDKIKKVLENKVTVFTGQTGAGKSTLLNKLFNMNLDTNEISLALGRGRHTTRVVEIIEIDNIKVLDTPGFSALSFLKYDLEKVKKSFIEFDNFPCMYSNCSHDKEPECMVKKAVLDNKILESRYLNYLNFKKEFERR